MAGQGDEGGVIVGEEVVEQAFEPRLLGRVGLALVGGPERIGFGEAGLEDVGGVGGVDVGFAAATVARVDADPLAEQLFHFGHEGMLARELQAGKRNVRRGQAAIQGTGVV